MSRSYIISKFVFAILLIPAGLVFLPELNAAVEQPVFFTGQWIHADKNVKKIFDTGIGAVYEFPASPGLGNLIEFLQKKNPKKISTLQMDLLDNDKRWGKISRYIVLEFDIRLFPAMSNDREPVLFFSVTRSSLPGEEIKNSYDINGIMNFDSQKPLFTFDSVYPIKKATSWVIISRAEKFNPSYRLNRCRIIFDSQSKEGLYSTNINGFKCIWKSNEKLPSNAIRSFGILLQPFSKSHSKIQKRFFEISPPRFFMTDSQNDLAALPNVTIPADVYKTGQISPSQSPKLIRNPDELYALAMQYLQGQDLIEGIALLEKAEKQKHVGAMYQLGMCYARGIGVETDIPKALRYLQDAAEYGYPEAFAWYSLLYIRTARPSEWTSQRQNASDLSKFHRFGRDYPAMRVQENMLLERFLSDTTHWPLNNSNKIRFLLARESRGEFYYAQHPFWNKSSAQKQKSKWPGLGLASSNSYLADLKNYKNFWDECLKKSHIPALLYQGRLSAQKNDQAGMAEALALFSEGAAQGDLDCIMEAMLLKFRQGRLVQFVSAADRQYSDHPLYEILKYAIDNPEDSGSRLLAQGKTFAAIEEWGRGNSARQKFLYGLGLIYSFYHYGFDSWIYRTTINDTRELKLAQTAFDAAAHAGLPEAQYWAAKMRLEIDQTFQAMYDNPRYPAGLALLAQAEAQGFMQATCLLLEMEFKKNGRILPSQMQKLNVLCEKIPSGRLWQLQGEVLLAKSGKHSSMSKTAKDAFNAFTKATEAGVSRGYYQLGVCYYFGIGTEKNVDNATYNWKKFIGLEQQKYLNDINDLSYEPILPETVFCIPQLNQPENYLNPSFQDSSANSSEDRKIYSVF